MITNATFEHNQDQSDEPVVADVEHHGDDNVAHHFESAQQQFDAGKLGMWLFLVTEILFFSGLFVAYAVYRFNHPEIFLDAHKYLNTTLGGLNTIVLLFSSLTMAWAVRSAQLGNRKALIFCLGVTLACASLFLGVKAVEYSHKWEKGLLWAGAYSADSASHEHHAIVATSLVVLSLPALISCGVCALLRFFSMRSKNVAKTRFWAWLLIVSLIFFAGIVTGEFVERITHTDSEVSKDVHVESVELVAKQASTGVFFSIYYAMTAVHAIHILAGMGVIAWLLRRSIHGEFGPRYFGPVDYVGLYWHIVDLVWIYLFPLLYLIR